MEVIILLIKCRWQWRDSSRARDRSQICFRNLRSGPQSTSSLALATRNDLSRVNSSRCSLLVSDVMQRNT